MKRLVMFFLLVALALPALGCFHNQIVVSPNYDPSVTTPSHEEIRLHVLGLVPIGSTLNLDQICPQGAGVVESRMIFDFRLLSIGQARVYCGQQRGELEQELPAVSAI